MNWTYIMNEHHWLVKKYLRTELKMGLNRGEIYKTQSMMYDERFIVIIKFTGSRFNYSLIDFKQQKILCACDTWKNLIKTIKRLAEG